MSKEDELKTIHEIIDMIRYYIQADGGDLEFLSYENDIVTLKITGNCVGCNIQDVTYKDGLLQILKLDLPNIKDVVLIEEKSDINALWDEFDQQQQMQSPLASLSSIKNNEPPSLIDQQVKEIDLNNDDQVEIIDHTKEKKTLKTAKKKKTINARKTKTTKTTTNKKEPSQTKPKLKTKLPVKNSKTTSKKAIKTKTTKTIKAKENKRKK
ncbi:NifU family protein [bacterium]|nr:NifU family protein [bacterium]